MEVIYFIVPTKAEQINCYFFRHKSNKIKIGLNEIILIKLNEGSSDLSLLRMSFSNGHTPVTAGQ